MATKKNSETAAAKASSLQPIADIVVALTDKIGISGALLFFGCLFVVYYATLEQKQRLIDMYLLGNGLGSFWPNVVVALLALCVIAMQQSILKGRIRQLQEEVAREGREKSRLQEKLQRRTLQHGGTA